MAYKIVCQVVSGRNTYWKHGTMIRVLSPDDQTALIPKEYDKRCTACVVKHAHSLGYHIASIKEGGKK